MAIMLRAASSGSVCGLAAVSHMAATTSSAAARRTGSALPFGLSSLESRSPSLSLLRDACNVSRAGLSAPSSRISTLQVYAKK
ncbi:hypothetical protein CBR_g70204, partial [Chara braunii]